MPTRGRPDILKIALVRLPYPTQIDNLNELSSDHNPILLETLCTPISTSTPSTNRFLIWTKYKTILTNLSDTPIRPKTDKRSINLAIDCLTKRLQDAIEASVFTPKLRDSSFLFPDYIKLELTEKNQLRRQWQKNRDPTIKRQLNAKILLIRTLLKTHKTDQWDTFLNSLDQQDISIYKLNKCLLQNLPDPQPLMGPNGLVFPAKDRAELIADSLEHQFQTDPGPDIPQVTAYNQSLQNFNTTNSKLFTTPGTIQNNISNPRKKKSPGDDLITNSTLKFLPSNTLLSLTQIINSSFRICYFPPAWNKAVIISIPKPGKDHKLSENYRPITLLSSLIKIYEQLILTLLSDKIRPEQFAFRPKHSTTQQLTKLTHQLSQNFNNNIKTASIFLDVEKAFDRVWHAGLLFKLSQLNISTEIVKIIESFLTDRTFITKIEDSFSSTRHILATLYLTYINDIPTTPKAHISLFADDTMFFTYDT
ncbi:hypothetical protein QTP88_003061 [Uroleucon formosanum]